MAECFIGEIRLFGFGFAPRGWALCNGQFLPVPQNQALFSLLGMTYGGNGQTTFALPDLRSRIPLGYGPSADPSWSPSPAPLGATYGVERVSLVAAQLPSHTHAVNVATAATTGAPGGGLLASSAAAKPYRSGANGLVPLEAGTVKPAGGGQAHSNLQPYQTINFAIALQGAFPSRN